MRQAFNQPAPLEVRQCAYMIPGWYLWHMKSRDPPDFYRRCRHGPKRLLKDKWYCVTHYRMQLEKQS
jgi:hypothetical protein